ncbi:hypothetical protein PTKIN_Ptkin02bG0093000 [Pterospermum kingtungense]
MGWKMLILGVVKINVDVAFVYGSGFSQTGMVARDSNGIVLYSTVSSGEVMFSPLHAELMAILNGLILAKSQGFDVIVVESDCLVAIQEFKFRILLAFGSL